MIQTSWVTKDNIKEINKSLGMLNITKYNVINLYNNINMIIITQNITQQQNDQLDEIINATNLEILKIPINNNNLDNTYLSNIIIALLYKNFNFIVEKNYYWTIDGTTYIIPLISKPVVNRYVPNFYYNPDMIVNHHGLTIPDINIYNYIYVNKLEYDMIINRLNLDSYKNLKLLIDSSNSLVTTNPLAYLSLYKLSYNNIDYKTVGELLVVDIDYSNDIIMKKLLEISDNLYGQTLKYIEKGYLALYKVNDEQYTNIANLCELLGFKIITLLANNNHSTHNSDNEKPNDAIDNYKLIDISKIPYIYVKTLTNMDYIDNIINISKFNELLDCYINNIPFSFKISGNWVYKLNLNTNSKILLKYIVHLAYKQLFDNYYNTNLVVEPVSEPNTNMETSIKILRMIEKIYIDDSLTINIAGYDMKDIQFIYNYIDTIMDELVAKLQINNLEDIKNIPNLLTNMITIKHISWENALLYYNYLTLYYPECNPLYINGSLIFIDNDPTSDLSSLSNNISDNMSNDTRNKLIKLWVQTNIQIIRNNQNCLDTINKIIERNWIELTTLSSNCTKLSKIDQLIYNYKLTGIV